MCDGVRLPTIDSEVFDMCRPSKDVGGSRSAVPLKPSLSKVPPSYTSVLFGVTRSLYDAPMGHVRRCG